jgi:ComF family protein
MAPPPLQAILNHPLGGQITLGHRLVQLRDRSLGLWLSSPCPLCQRPANNALCLDCHRQFLACHQPEYGRSSPGATPWPIWSWGYYDGMIKRSIAAFKYNNQGAIGDLFGQCLAADWPQIRATLAANPNPQLLPIPVHADKLTHRGFNQVSLIGQALSRATGLPLLDRGLIRQRATQPQFELSPQAREQNLAGAFTLGPDLQRRSFTPGPSSRSLIILDDIYTSGATARAAAATLEAGGHRVLGIWVVALAHSASRPKP